MSIWTSLEPETIGQSYDETPGEAIEVDVATSYGFGSRQVRVSMWKLEDGHWAGGDLVGLFSTEDARRLAAKLVEAADAGEH